MNEEISSLASSSNITILDDKMITAEENKIGAITT